MDRWITNITLAFSISAIFAGVLIPKILLIAFRKKLFDTVDERKSHTVNIPRLGGVAFTPVIFFTLLLLLGANEMQQNMEFVEQFYQEMLTLTLGGCALLMLYLLGVADDLIGIRYSGKFLIQFLASVLIILSGLYIDNLHGILGIYELPYFVGCAITVVIILLLVNSINMLDGIDGLASGITAIALVYYGILFYLHDLMPYALLSFAALGTIVPFFYYNVWGSPERHKKIFMGDTGSLTLGIILSILCLKLATLPESTLSIQQPSFRLAFYPIIIPCLDVIRLFCYRISIKQSPFLPDKNHIHHKFLGLGLMHTQSTFAILTISVLFTVVNVVVSQFFDINLQIIFNILCWCALIVLLNYLIKKKSK